MGWGSGVFTRTNGVYTGSSVWAQDEGAGVDITSSRHDTHDLDLANGINACVNKDGSNAANVVTTSWIADSNVTTAKIADSNVTTAKIANGAITEAKLDDDACTRSTLLATFVRSVPTTGLSNQSIWVPDTQSLFLHGSGSAAAPVTTLYMPKAGKATHLTMSLSAAPGGANSIAATLRKNGTTTSQTITISNTIVTIGAYQAITSQSFVAGDGLDVIVTGTPTTGITMVVNVWGHFTA